MDRRLFLTGMLGIAGTAALTGMVRPGGALAGVPQTGGGILDALDAPPVTDYFEGEETGEEAQPVRHRRRRRRRRRHRRRVWRRVCRRYWRHGRLVRRCFRRRVWIWVWI